MIPLAFHGHNKPVMACRFNDDGDLLFTASKDGAINVYRTEDGERMGTYKGHRSILDLGINHSSTLMLSAGMDFKTNLWEVETGKLIDTIDAESIVRCVGFAHDDSVFFTVTDGMREVKPSISFYNLPGCVHHGERSSAKYNPCALFSTPEKIMYAAWGPTNDHLYFGSDDGSVSILDVETQQEICNKMPHSKEVRRLNFDANYMTLATASADKSACLLDMRTLNTVQTYKADMPINDCSISPLGDHVLLAGGTEAQDVTTTGGGDKFGVRFYHKVYGDYLGQIFCHFGTIHRVAFHPSGKGFATGAEDGFAKLHMFEPSYFKSTGAQPVWQPPEEEEEEAPEDDEEAEEEDA
uniref:Serine-threonine kinase receptor-associated protein n=1 Tax=Neobodo designis TaxID=312471 RepID=A0A7S1W5I7_NEODS|mmetsp:Transcript_53615/g.164883  ORF Transcript_53615/g.164883 Transcript_53615/m.164883 type:complete len:353 (+) Transcript_53615:91-1149(+)|eukprot:CAMPEP_0174828526 /NCGR_PEP_ID=MMETSP1114-20130205/1384_1 /TAXON_ID=312471 /ORGANISM="Neobodo designis, Strain CCAP 1951/1" /LENGTH=352 /DNA_ID=CAMNT_0016062247 /DNA_START=91 /DNA_END=1149 /DNA_ORIENTATION=-